MSKEYPRRSFQLAIEDVCLAFRKCVIAGDRLGNHPTLSKWSEKITRSKERSEGKIQDEKDYPNEEMKREGWKQNKQVKAVPREEGISTSWTATPYAISDFLQS